MNDYRKHILVVVTCLLLSQYLVATTRKVEMPGEFVLQERLNSIAMEQFAIQTRIAVLLAHQHKTPVEVIKCVDVALDSYHRYLEKNVPIVEWAACHQSYIQLQRPFIIGVLLQGDQEALAEAQRIIFNQQMCANIV